MIGVVLEVVGVGVEEENVFVVWIDCEVFVVVVIGFVVVYFDGYVDVFECMVVVGGE